jgi:uncharacterized protein YcbX
MTGAAGSVASLLRYPVKSMMGEDLGAAQVTAHGLLGDRSYALCDSETGKVVSAKNPRKWPHLFRYRAEYVTPPVAESATPAVRVMLPDGAFTVSSSPDFAPVLSAALGRPVTLLSKPPEKPQLEEYWSDREEHAADAVTDEAMPPGTFFDLAIVHLLTTSTLVQLSEFGPQSRFEPRRFRPNFIIDTGGQKGFVENNWIDKTIAIGPEVRLRVAGPCPRCVMTTLAQGDLPKDPAVLKTAAQHNNGHVGVYCSVIQEGTVRVGDSFAVV